MIRHAVIAGAALIGCAAPGAAADATREVRTEPLCEAIRDALAVGERDWSFASLQSTAIPPPKLEDVEKDGGNGVPALLTIPGFKCVVRTTFGTLSPVGNDIGGAAGFYECSRYDLTDGGAEAARVATVLGPCLGIKPDSTPMTFGRYYDFRWRDNPQLSVTVISNGLKNEGMILQINADHPEPSY